MAKQAHPSQSQLIHLGLTPPPKTAAMGGNCMLRSKMIRAFALLMLSVKLVEGHPLCFNNNRCAFRYVVLVYPLAVSRTSKSTPNMTFF